MVEWCVHLEKFATDVFGLFYQIIDNSDTLTGPNFIIKDLPSVLILIIADQRFNDSLCCSNKYN